MIGEYDFDIIEYKASNDSYVLKYLGHPFNLIPKETLYEDLWFHLQEYMKLHPEKVVPWQQPIDPDEPDLDDDKIPTVEEAIRQLHGDDD